MQLVEILSNSNKIKTVDDLLNHFDLVVELAREDILKIAKSKRLKFNDFDFAYSCSVEIIKKQLLKKHLQAIQRFFNFDNLENALKWLISRILNNMRNITTNKNFKLFIDFKISNFEYEVYADNDDFEKMIQILDIQKLDKSIIKKGLCKVWKESKYDEDFDYVDFSELCTKYGFEPDKVVGSHASAQIQFKKQLIDNYKYQLELII